MSIMLKDHMITVIKVVTLSDKVNLTQLDQYNVALKIFESVDEIPKFEIHKSLSSILTFLD